MALRSVYLPEPVASNGIIQITDEEHRHLLVARAQPDEMVEVFNGRGHVWTCEVREVSKRSTSVRIVGEQQIPSPAVELILGLALIQRSPFELALEKSVETGVSRIIPFVASRSNVARGDKHERSEWEPDRAKPARKDRWQRIVVEAAKQSKRFHLPSIDATVKFEDLLQTPAASKILFAEHGGGPLKSALAGSPVLYLVGPEGGWTEDELKAATGVGFRLVSLGAGILRSETAAIVGAFLIRYELGDI